MAKTQETASVDCGDELQKIYKVQPRLSRLHLNIPWPNIEIILREMVIFG